MGDQDLVSAAAPAAPLVRSFAPACRGDARVLILGSMPGVASLTAGRYYAHPRNAFWPIMGELCGAGPALPYDARLARLADAGIALWDVIARCTRAGSLDSAIAADSIEANDFAALYAACPALTHVFFNGTAAATAYRRHVAADLAPAALRFVRLPSTSPAHAARSLADKLTAWQAVSAALGAQRRAA